MLLSHSIVGGSHMVYSIHLRLHNFSPLQFLKEPSRFRKKKNKTGNQIECKGNISYGTKVNLLTAQLTFLQVPNVKIVYDALNFAAADVGRRLSGCTNDVPVDTFWQNLV